MNKISLLSSELISILENARIPAQPVPQIMLLCEVLKRGGISGSLLFASIASRLGLIGIPTEKNIDGSDNKILGVIKIISEEIVRAIKDDAVVINVIRNGQLLFRAKGGNAGGETELIAQNTQNNEYKGIIQ